MAATAVQASDLAATLVERGHDVTVVCGRRAYDNAGERYAREEVWRGVHIRRIASLELGKKARWRRAADFGSFLTNCAMRLAGLPRFDLVIALTSPPLISWLAAWFVRIKGGRFVFWVMDLNPDEALAAGWLRPGSWTTRRLTRMLNVSLQRATNVVALDSFMARRIEAKGIPAAKIVVVPPWPLEDVVRNDVEGRQRFRAEHGLDGKYVVMYSGNHSPCHPLTTLLEAARSLRDREDIVFCFVGGGSEFENVGRYAERHGVKNIVRLPYQPLERLGASLSSADLHVVVMGEPFVGIVHPSKVYNVRALGLPYLYIGPAASHIADLQPTFSADHGDVDAVVRQIEAAARQPSRVETTREARFREHALETLALTLESAAFGSVHLPFIVSQPAQGR